MKRFALFIILSLLTAGYIHAQNGTWSGKIDVKGMPLTLIFNIGEETCTLDVPDQGAKGIEVTRISGQGSSITLDIPSIGAKFSGIYLWNRIVGTFTQFGTEFPLTLTPGAPAIRRPQTPQGPFPYKTEEVSFTNGDAVLKGTLTIPENCNSDTPVFVLVTGSGLQNRDEEIFSHKPFAVIADAFARKGIATLRYDDRGFGESTGDIINVTTEDLKDDALAGVEFMRGRFGTVGVLGHSEGGTIALMLAAEQKTDMAISLAGMAISGKETIIDQNRYSLRQAKFDGMTIEKFCTALSEALDRIIAGKSPQPIDGLDIPEILKEAYRESASTTMGTPYMRYFLATDISGKLSTVTCPVLALNGTKDCQVNHEKNLTALKEGLKNGNSQNRIEACEGLNHLFQHCTTGHVQEYREIEETFSPEVISLMTDWITGQKSDVE